MLRYSGRAVLLAVPRAKLDDAHPIHVDALYQTSDEMLFHGWTHVKACGEQFQTEIFAVKKLASTIRST